MGQEEHHIQVKVCKFPLGVGGFNKEMLQSSMYFLRSKLRTFCLLFYPEFSVPKVIDFTGLSKT